MTVPAAHAGQSGPKPIEHTVRHPGAEHPLGCPNCRSGDDLVLIERATVNRLVAAVFKVDVATVPEVDPMTDEWTDRDLDEAKPVELIGVRCKACRWGYEGPNPLNVLTAVPE